MHILAIIVGVLGAVGIVLWRMQQAANATRDIADAAGEVGGLFRRLKWLRKANVNPMDLVDDPREAAAAMMVAIAQADGPLTDKERAVIIAEMARTFDANGDAGEELLARGRWLTRDSVDAGNVMRRLTGVIVRKCGPKERAELIDMLEATAAADGRADETVARDIARFAESIQA